MRTAEHLLLARYFDYQQVSFHKTVAAYEQLLEEVLGDLMTKGMLDCSAAAMTARAANPSSWVEFDDASVTTLIRQRALGDANTDVGVHKARCLLQRNGPRLVWSYERFAGRHENATSLAMMMKVLNGQVKAIADEAGLPADHLYVWHGHTRLTAIGSVVPASHVVDVVDKEEAALGVSIFIGEPGAKSTPLAECPESLVHVLADQSLAALRLYALPPVAGHFNRPNIEAIAARHMALTG